MDHSTIRQSTCLLRPAKAFLGLLPSRGISNVHLWFCSKVLQTYFYIYLRQSNMALARFPVQHQPPRSRISGESDYAQHIRILIAVALSLGLISTLQWRSFNLGWLGTKTLAGLNKKVMKERLVSWNCITFIQPTTRREIDLTYVQKTVGSCYQEILVVYLTIEP